MNQDTNRNGMSRKALREQLEAIQRHLEKLDEAEGKQEGEGSPAPAADDSGQRRDQRRDLGSSVEFMGDFDVVEAEGIDVSTGGICFETSEPLVFDMRIREDVECTIYRAQLVWMRRLSDGRVRFGFEFVGTEKEVEL